MLRSVHNNARGEGICCERDAGERAEFGAEKSAKQ